MTELPPNVRVVSTLPADHAGYDITATAVMQKLSAAEDTHFWFLSRNELICGRLGALGVNPPATILELGCGGGCVSAYLARHGYRVVGIDGHVSLVERAARRAPTAEFIVHDLGRGVAEATDDEYDAVGFFDVIEHLDDPESALLEAVYRVKPGGLIVGTVPALMSLWSDIDVQSGHKLRYERDGLQALLANIAGTTVVEITDFNRSLVSLMWVQRKKVTQSTDSMEHNLDIPAAPVNRGLLGTLRFEQKFAARLDRSKLKGASLWFALRVSA